MIGHEVFVTGFLATASLMRYVTLRRKGVGESRNGKNIRDFNPFDAAYVAQIFEQLESKIESHILEKSIPAQTVFDVDDRIKEGNVNIPIMSLEKALKLYLDIKNQHADYIQPVSYTHLCVIAHWSSDSAPKIQRG